MLNKDLLIKLIRDILKNVKEENYSTNYGEGLKQGKIEAIEEILKLIG